MTVAVKHRYKIKPSMCVSRTSLELNLVTINAYVPAPTKLGIFVLSAPVGI